MHHIWYQLKAEDRSMTSPIRGLTKLRSSCNPFTGGSYESTNWTNLQSQKVEIKKVIQLRKGVTTKNSFAIKLQNTSFNKRKYVRMIRPCVNYSYCSASHMVYSWSDVANPNNYNIALKNCRFHDLDFLCQPHMWQDEENLF